MKVFISWSGETSKKVAVALKHWVESTIQATEPWISMDIEKGKRWSKEISNSLESTEFGIVCVTRDNMTAPWLLFEAGAIAKNSGSNACVFLTDLESTDLTGPLSDFQHTSNNREDLKRLIEAINNKVMDLGGRSLKSEILDTTFNHTFPTLEKELQKAIQQRNNGDKNEVIRSDRELLEEAVQIMRNLDKNRPMEPSSELVGEILEFYAKAFAKIWDIDYRLVGTQRFIREFLNLVKDEPIFMNHFGSVGSLAKYIRQEFNGQHRLF